MTSVLIPLASMAPMPIPALMTAQAVTAEIDFSQQLLSLMGSLETDSDGEAKIGIAGQQSSESPEQEKKKEELPAAPVLMSAFPSLLPARLAASFGLPSAGDEAVDELVPLTAAPAPDLVDMVDLEIEAPAPMPRVGNSAASPSPKGELAFAVRLTDFTSHSESQPAEVVTAAQPQVSRTEPARLDRDTQRPLLAATVAMPVEPVPTIETARISNETQHPAPQTTPAVITAPRQDSAAVTPVEPGVVAEPVRTSNETQRPEVSATPVGREKSQQESSNTDSFLSDDKQPDRQTASSTPRLRQTTDFEPWSNSTQIETIEVAAPRETVSQIPSPAPAAFAAASATAPRPSAAPVNVDNAVAGSPALQIDPAPVAQPSSRSELTEISITVPVSRPEAPGDERVAIHMVQKGTEIHVSVRTPDQDIAQTLREDLTRLARSLDEAGFRAETWRPAATTVAGLASTNTQRDMAQETPNRNTAGEDGPPSGNNGREQGEQRRRQQDDRPRWVAELEQYRN